MFQTLIGTVKSAFDRIGEGYDRMFQTLIGTVKRCWPVGLEKSWSTPFQTLIGTVKRRASCTLRVQGMQVSNPHRYGQKLESVREVLNYPTPFQTLIGTVKSDEVPSPRGV